MPANPRPETSVILGVSMPADLKARIKALAEKDDRKMAQWCALRLREIVEEIELEHSNVARFQSKVAEEPVKYRTKAQESKNRKAK